jgi:integrase
MPKLVHLVPRLRHHKASGRAVVTLNGKDHYLGLWRSAESKAAYERLIGEWLTAGRTDPVPAGRTVAELAAAYLRFARGHYVKNGRCTATIYRIQVAVKELRSIYGRTPVAEFRPASLRAIQQKLAKSGKSRSYVNLLIAAIRRMFKWGVEPELVPVHVFQGLKAIEGLRKGRSEARETEPVGPVPDSIVDLTIPHLPAAVADMVRLQKLTGARPSEICSMTKGEIDRSGEVWAYRVSGHKTEHHGHERIVFIGPKAQAILAPYLVRSDDAYCFSPFESEKDRNENRRSERKTPMTPSHAKRRRKRRPKRAPGDFYSTGSYRRAIHRACDLADKLAHKQQPDIATDKRMIPRWSPNQLRHAKATEIRKDFGLEAAQVVLGHRMANVTQVYADRDYAKAAAVAKVVG